MKNKNSAALLAILAAALYAINIPLSKLFLQHVQPTMMAALLYLGAGFGLMIFKRQLQGDTKSEPLTRQELPFTLGMIILDIAAPILLMMGLERTSSANASLLNNFEIVATSLIAFFLFRECYLADFFAAVVDTAYFCIFGQKLHDHTSLSITLFHCCAPEQADSHTAVQ